VGCRPAATRRSRSQPTSASSSRPRPPGRPERTQSTPPNRWRGQRPVQHARPVKSQAYRPLRNRETRGPCCDPLARKDLGPSSLSP
jgi:hypothetical protein